MTSDGLLQNEQGQVWILHNSKVHPRLLVAELAGSSGRKNESSSTGKIQKAFHMGQYEYLRRDIYRFMHTLPNHRIYGEGPKANPQANGAGPVRG